MTAPRHMAPSTSSWRHSVAAIVTVVVLFVALMAAACSMAPRQSPDSRSDHCGELDDDIVCEGE